MKDFLKVIRLKNVLIIALTMILMRQCVFEPVFWHYGLVLTSSSLGFFMTILATMMIAAGGYVINDYYDIRIDRVNKGMSIVGDKFPRRKAIAMHLWFSIIGFIFGIVATIYMERFWFIFIFLFEIVFLWLYSLKFKKATFWGNFVVAVITAMVPAIVGLAEYMHVRTNYPEWPMEYINAVKMSEQVVIFFTILAFITTLMREIIKDCEDIEGDKTDGVQSIPVVIGLKKTNIVIFSISLIAATSIDLFWHIYLGETLLFEHNKLIYIYFHTFLSFPILAIGIASLFGTSKRKYTILSALVKTIMIFGLIFSLLFSYTIIGNGNI
ncbi:MAG: geranylgeranylglycerol-phosphate geranylgeranyltransferase [Bacteroidales bacterium]|nr:geranylgeranylglycerol-phosphate geranylgeranyltransferase [Bacteroidales bacterium]